VAADVETGLVSLAIWAAERSVGSWLCPSVVRVGTGAPSIPIAVFFGLIVTVPFVALFAALVGLSFIIVGS
jgi:ABC-type sulfate transport system permease subunit